MGVRQAISGNPETKYVWLTEEFTGGANIAYADDNTADSEFRQLLNYNLDSRGALEKRKGYAKNSALTELLFSARFGNVPDFPMFERYKNEQDGSLLKNIVLFKFIENTNNIWSLLGDAESLDDFQSRIITDITYKLKVLIIAQYNDGSNKYFINKYQMTKDEITREGSSGTLDVDVVADRNFMSVVCGEDTTKLYITANEQGLVIFDKEKDTFSYVNAKGDSENVAYKPNSIEIRKVGFNVLGDDPLSWIDSSTLTTESIQGIYLTTEDRIPVLIVPSSYKFQVNIIYTGTKNEFDISLKDSTKSEDNDITIESSKNEDLSTSGLAVYDVTIKVQPAGEVEFNIKFKDTGVNVSTYRDYYTVGTVDPQAQKVEQLNVGEMKCIEIAQRLVYYGKNAVWFSEINRYDYIPNYNYVLFPLENTDEIVKIAYYRTSYMIFTKRRIYKFVGTFGNDDFGVVLVNDTIGCIAPESVYMVSNEMYFLSQTGLKSLKNDVFRENLENIEDLDEKVSPYIFPNEYAYGFLYKDQYALVNNLRGDLRPVDVRYKEYYIPDTCRYYYNTEAFVFDQYASEGDVSERLFPYFVIYDSGEIYTFLKDKDGTSAVWRYGDGYSDFNVPFTAMLETAGINMNYPLHKKKIKNIILKCTGGELTQPLYVKVYSDGAIAYDTWVGATRVLPTGEVVYEVTNEPTLELPPSVAKLGGMELGVTKLGNSPVILRKLKLPTACKNIAISIESMTDEKLVIMSIGYTYKIGKVKE